MKPTKNKVPRHIGIVLDGNRRFSKKLMAKPWKGHEWGAKKVEKVATWAKQLGIKEITLYAFSIENFNRPKQEFDFLMRLFKKECDRILSDKRIKKDKIRINFIGRIDMFPRDVYKKMKRVMTFTKDHHNYIMNFAMAYGGRTEVIDATRKIALQIKKGKLTVDKINEEVFAKNLYMESEPDLVIRTGGEKRTSNFLIWQANYAEWIFLDKTWPEFEKEDLIEAVQEYQSRERRFGR